MLKSRNNQIIILAAILLVLLLVIFLIFRPDEADNETDSDKETSQSKQNQEAETTKQATPSPKIQITEASPQESVETLVPSEISNPQIAENITTIYYNSDNQKFNVDNLKIKLTDKLVISSDDSCILFEADTNEIGNFIEVGNTFIGKTGLDGNLCPGESKVSQLFALSFSTPGNHQIRVYKCLGEGCLSSDKNKELAPYTLDVVVE